jgi:quercetin dioxygenase-like cupin family protein
MPVRKTSHVDTNTGSAITKQQFLEPFLVPNVAGFSVVTIQRNQTVEMHSHRSMHEFFYVLEGSATFFMNDDANNNDDGQRRRQGRPVVPGTFVHFLPNCVHGIVVADDDDNNSTWGDLKVLLVGVTVGD